MKWLLILMFLVGCEGKLKTQNNINEFTNSCEKLAECMEKPYKVSVNVRKNGLTCSISVDKVNGHAHFYPENGLDLEENLKWGYDFLESAHRVCEILKEKGSYTKLQKNRRYRFGKCVDLDPKNEEHRAACFKQYQNDDGTLDNKEECDINCKLEKISKIKK